MPTPKHNHQWVSGWTMGRKVFRECPCGTVVLPNGKVVKSRAREYYRAMWDKWQSD